MKSKKMWVRLRNYFLTGLVVSAPIGLTLYITWALVHFVDRQVASLVPEPYTSLFFISDVRIPGVGLIVAGLLLILIGWMAAGVFGRYFLGVSEKLIGATPVVRSVYGAAKQIFTTILRSNSNTFRKVVIVEFPRPGCYALGFVTNEGPSDIDGEIGKRLWTIFLPTAPNPTSGYLLFFERKDVVLTDMTVEEGLKLVVSGGIISRPQRRKAVRKLPRRRPSKA